MNGQGTEGKEWVNDEKAEIGKGGKEWAKNRSEVMGKERERRLDQC